MGRKRKCYWIKAGEKFIQWKKLALCDTIEEAHIWKSEKTVNKYRDIVSEMYTDIEVLVYNDFELYAVAINLDHKEKELKDDFQKRVDEIINEDPEIVEERDKESLVEIDEEKGTKIDKHEDVKTFKEYLSDDDDLKDSDFDFDIDV